MCRYELYNNQGDEVAQGDADVREDEHEGEQVDEQGEEGADVEDVADAEVEVGDNVMATGLHDEVEQLDAIKRTMFVK